MKIIRYRGDHTLDHPPNGWLGLDSKGRSRQRIFDDLEVFILIEHNDYLGTASVVDTLGYKYIYVPLIMFEEWNLAEYLTMLQKTV